MMKLLNELKRRNVFKVGAAYLVLAWIVIQITDAAVPALHLPEWVNSLVFLFGMIGFPFAIFFAWAFEMTPEGIKKESEVDRDESITATTGKKLEYSIIGLLVIALGYFIWSGQTAQKTAAPTQQQLSSQKTDKPQTKSPNTETPKIETAQTEALLDKSIAVLPFSNRSNNQEDVFFVDGMHDDLLTKLAKSHELRVISRTSVLEYRNTTKKIPQIAQELGVNHILEGGVQRSGNHIRVNAQLINAATDEHLWAETYDKELNIDNVFAIQTEITVAIAKALEAVLSPEEKKQINKPLTNNLLAWQAYREGFEMYSSEDNGHELVIKLYKKAIELDPKFAVAYASMSTVYMNAYWFGVNIEQPKQKAWQAIESSRALDNNTAELFNAEAAYYYWGFRDFGKALAAIESAIAIAPNNVQARSIHGYLLRRMGNFDASIKSLDLAASLNPRSMQAFQENAETSVNLLRYKDAESYIEKVEKITSDDDHIANIKAALALNRDGDLDAALQQFAINKESYPGSAVGYWWTLLTKGKIDESIKFAQNTKLLINMGPYYSSAEQMTGLSYFVKGDLSQTKKYLQISIEQLNVFTAEDPGNKNYLVSLCQAHAALNNTEKAEVYCKKALTKTDDLYDYPFDLLTIVEAYAMLGAKEQALSLLQKALEFEIRNSAHYLRLDPFLQNLHDDPRFETLIQRIDSGELVTIQ